MIRCFLALKVSQLMQDLGRFGTSMFFIDFVDSFFSDFDENLVWGFGFGVSNLGIMFHVLGFRV